ncbi:MAG: hypothetical protein A6F70_06625 [Cycloclasticus sp. symbiont of Bathymodiolus heckerae]|nr:MAG: hypothetical protein A6F70_06625 [Cycloclasticus sp. symbiont of Bathymodiolus heckerae]
MIIQANLPNVSLATAPKKVLSKEPTPNDDAASKRSENNQTNGQSTPTNAERTELFEQVESLNNNEKANFRTSDVENRNQKLIQSYLDNKALENQDIRDELHEQLGIDALA